MKGNDCSRLSWWIVKFSASYLTFHQVTAAEASFTKLVHESNCPVSASEIRETIRVGTLNMNYGKVFFD